MHIYVSWGGGGGHTSAALPFPIWNKIFIYTFIYLKTFCWKDFRVNRF